MNRTAPATWLIDGPPGTGKTTYLARQAKRATETHGPTGVIACSLTRTAAKEIAGRDTGIPEHHVGTLHAHAYRALDQPQLAETPEGRAEWNREHPSLSLTGAGDPLEDTPVDSSDRTGRSRGDHLHAQIMNRRARLQPIETWTPREQEYGQLWNDFKQQTHRLDFTDLIETCVRDTSAHPLHPKALFLDEAQDFSRLELKLAWQWAQATKTTIVCGDPRQAIYSWRGADPNALTQLQTAGQRTLHQSHRVPASVHQLAQNWIRQAHQPADYQPTQLAGHVGRLGVAYRNPEQLIPHISRRLEQDDRATIMVLAACGYMLSPLLNVLRDHGIPFHNPHRPTHGGWNPLRGARRLLAFLRPDDSTWDERARCWTWADLKAWTGPLRADQALARGSKALIENKCRADRFGESQRDHEVPLEQLLQLLGTTDIHHPAIMLNVDWWASMLRHNQRSASRYPLEILRRRGGLALRQTPRLVVGTGHSVKGAEADHVLVFPDLSRAGMWDGWHLGGETRAQIIRLVYVMLTRARQTVTLLDASHPEHIPSPLGLPEAA